MTDAPLVFDAILIGKVGKPDIRGTVLFEAVCLEDSRPLALKRDRTVFFLVQRELARYFEPKTIYRIPVLQMEAFYQAEANSDSYSAFLCGKPEKRADAILIARETDYFLPLHAAEAAPYEHQPLPVCAASFPKRNRTFPNRPPRRIGTPQKHPLTRNRRYDFSG